MIPFVQLFRHQPDAGIWGDCHRAAVCSILETDPTGVPHFGEGGPDAFEFDRRVRTWLIEQGFIPVSVLFDAPLEDVLHSVGRQNPGVYYLLGGQSKTGVDHTVVCIDDEIVHDPSQNQSGIVGPCHDGFYWVTFLVTEASSYWGQHTPEAIASQADEWRKEEAERTESAESKI